MTKIDKRHFNKGTGKKKKDDLPLDVDLSSIETSKTSFQMIIEAYLAGQLKEQRFGRTIYGLQNYLPYLKASLDLDIEKRLSVLEERINSLLVPQLENLENTEKTNETDV